MKGIRVIDFNKPARPIHWLVRELFPFGHLSFLGALYGVGKTAVMVYLCVQLSRPKGEFFGISLKQAPSLYVNFDNVTGDAQGVRYWRDKFMALYPDADPSLFTVIEPDGVVGITDDVLASVAELVEQTKSKVIIWDSFEACFPGVSIVRGEQIRDCVLPLERFSTEFGVSSIILDHLPKPSKGEAAGERGLKGNTTKSAMARAVHVLTTVPPKKVSGRNVVQWRVDKNSFGPKPEPFGFEIVVNEDTADLKPYDLPDEYQDTMLARATRHLVDYLLDPQRMGATVPRKDLEQQAREGGVTSKGYITKAIKAAVAETGAREVKLPGKGSPLAYVVNPQPLSEGKGEPNGENTVQDRETFGPLPSEPNRLNQLGGVEDVAYLE